VPSANSAVIDLSQEFHRRDAEHAELTLRKTIIPTDSRQEDGAGLHMGDKPTCIPITCALLHFFLDTEKASATIRANTRKEVIQSNDKTKTW